MRAWDMGQTAIFQSQHKEESIEKDFLLPVNMLYIVNCFVKYDSDPSFHAICWQCLNRDSLKLVCGYMVGYWRVFRFNHTDYEPFPHSIA